MRSFISFSSQGLGQTIHGEEEPIYTILYPRGNIVRACVESILQQSIRA